MNALVQTSSGLIGSAEDLEKLASASKAVLLVVSDLHCDDYLMLKEIVNQFGQDSSAMVYCGDGAGDIVRYLSEAAEDPEMKAKLPPVIGLVRGNGDYGHYSSSRLAVDVPDRLVFKAAGRKIFAVHGHRYGVEFVTDALESAAETAGATVVLYGHTHIPEKNVKGNMLILNPGSAARPRGGSRPSLAVVSYPGVKEKYDVDFFSIGSKPFGGYEFNLISI